MNLDINLIDVIIVAIVGFSVFSGMYKGFIASGLTAVGFVAAWFLALKLFPYLAGALEKNESLLSMLTYYLDADGLFETRSLAGTLVSTALQGGQLQEALSTLQLPGLLVDAFQTNVANQQFAAIGLNTLAEYLNQTIWVSIINVLSFLLMFLVSYLVVVLFVNMLNAVFHFPLLKHFDWLLGGAFGFARGAVFVMLLLVVVPMITSVVELDMVNDMIAQSTIAQYFPQEFAMPDIIRRAFQ